MNPEMNTDVRDLLGRKSNIVNISQIHHYLKNQVVLITGAGGSIGGELACQVAKQSPNKLLLLGHGENSIFSIEMVVKETYPDLVTECLIFDIQDRLQLEEVFQRFKPSTVFHAAAHKHVILMEKNGVSAINNNIRGTKVLAETSMKYGVQRFVFISTDKAVNPANIMGATKRIGEMIIQQLAVKSETQFAIVRFGNVLESRGSVVPIFKKQLAQGGPLTVTHPDMIRYFMSIPEAVHLVLQAGALSKGGEIFILDMGEPIKILDLAKALIRLSGYEPDKDIPIVFTGVRPGEKISESLYDEDEKPIPSKHPLVSFILPKKLNFEILQSNLEQLFSLQHHNSSQIKQSLLNIIENMCDDIQGQESS